MTGLPLSARKIDKVKPFYILLVIAIGFTGCKSPDQPWKEKSIKIEQVCLLEEGEHLMSSPLDFDFIDQAHILVTTANGSIIQFDTTGKKLATIEHIGTGPLEYLMPSIIHTYEKSFYIWDQQLLELIEMDYNGTPIQEYDFFNRAIKDFAIVDDKVYTLTSGGNKNSLIEVFNLNTGQVVQEIGKPNAEDLILNLNEQAGGILRPAGDDRVLFLSPSKLDINILNQGTLSTFPLTDHEFQVNRLELDPIDFINSQRSEAINYLMQNSIVNGLHYTENNLIIQSEIGQYSLEDETLITRNRYRKFYFLEKSDFSIHHIAKLSLEINNLKDIYASNGQAIYAISEFKDVNHEGYALIKLTVD